MIMVQLSSAVTFFHSGRYSQLGSPVRTKFSIRAFRAAAYFCPWDRLLDFFPEDGTEKGPGQADRVFRHRIHRLRHEAARSGTEEP